MTPLLTPEIFTKDKHLPEKGLFIFTNIMLKAVKKKVTDIREFRWIPCHIAYTCNYNNEEIFVLKPYLGAPATIAALELAIGAGAREIVAYGEAGALSEKLSIGDYMVPTWGVREEGTSYHYMPPSYIPRPSEKIARKILEKTRKVLEGGSEDH